MLATLLGTAWSFAAAAAGCRWLSRNGLRSAMLDHPNERSLHSQPTPRSGGIAIALAGFSGAIVSLGTDIAMNTVGVACVAIFLIGLWDDIKGVGVAQRLLVQSLAGALLVGSGLSIDRVTLPGFEWMLVFPWGFLLAWLSVIWLTNLYNFMDGMDGFAGGMACIGFACFGILSLEHAPAAFPILCFTVSAAAGGFLLYNFPPAKIFMGDAGSSLLGFAAAGFALWAHAAAIFPLWISVLVFSPFVVDATVTLVWRALRAQPVWRAHKTHFYQRLVEAGVGHRKTTLGEYGLMVASAVSALFAVSASVFWQWIVILTWTAIYVGLMVWVTWVQRRNTEHGHHSSA